MKTLLKSGLLLMLFGMMVFSVQAQDDIPKREFKLGVSNSTIELIPGETTSLDVNIFRSKSYAKKEITFYAASLPKGLTMEMESPKTTGDVMVITLKADKTISAGKYTILLNGKSTRVTKGITFSVLVKDSSITKN